MIRHNLLLTFRSFKRFKSVFLINVIGLTCGLAGTLLIYLWVADELSVDQFIPGKDRLYWAWEHRVKADGIWTAQSTSGPLADDMLADFPEVDRSCVATGQYALLSVGDKTLSSNGRYAGKDFFGIFGYKILEGGINNMLTSKNSIVISESLAKKLFDTTHGVTGKTITRDHSTDFIVTGIFKDLPPAASQQFEFVIPFEEFADRNEWVKGWGSTGVATYIVLKKGVNVDEFNKKIADYVNIKANNESKYKTLFLKKYSEVYLYGNYANGVMIGGRISYVKLFSMIAIFILVIACINFMNLSTAKASRRVKEIGIKKSVGASRYSLISQYLGESVLVSMLALLLSILLVDLFLDKFNIVTGKHLTIVFDATFVITLLIIGIGAGVLAGSYPALYMSGFKAASVLKGKFGSSIGEVWVRKGLVGFQFAISVVLIVSVVVVYSQLEYIQSANLGYKKDNLLYFYRTGSLQDLSKTEALIPELKTIPGVINATTASHNFSGHNSGTWGIVWPGKDPEDHTEFENISANSGTLEILGIELAAGRSFRANSMADTSSLIINETGIKLMGVKNPIGMHVTLWGEDMQIIGVCKDFHYESLHEKLKPVFFKYSPGGTSMVMVKLSGQKSKETIAAIQSVYQKFNPEFPFEYKFLDANYQSMYQAEQRVAVLSKYFAGLAILISCLGLFALASFTAERRLKEIGIRKVLGSSEAGIVYLLSLDFTKIVLVAILIALPIGFFIARIWLESFAVKVPLKAWYFMSAGGASLLIAWLTVGLQSFKAAKVNPVKCLKEV